MLNEQQQKAVDTRVPTVLVSAGAGSGKTKVLTERYCNLLARDGLKVDQILTLTFTRKAAQEMRARIADHLANAEGALADERRKLMRAPIGTIHGFCERVLREHALQVGIDPNFRLLDEAEAYTLQENALDAVFERIWEQPQQDRPELAHLLLEFPHRELRRSLLSLFRTARTHGLAISAITPVTAPEVQPAAQELMAAAVDLQGLSGTATWQASVQQAAQALEELRPLLALSPEAFTWEGYTAAQPLLKRLTPNGGPREQAKLARDRIKEAASRWQGSWVDHFAAPYLRAFTALLQYLDELYRQAKDEQGLLDFSDLLLLTRDLLVTDAFGTGALERFRRQFRQVMVDEFQDTNTLQFGIIHALQGNGHLFAVGDVKQAIYRFIGSDLSVFLGQQQRVRAIGEGGQCLTMAVNYRSRPEVLMPLNAFFARLWAEREGVSGFSFEPLTAGAQFVEKTVPSIEMAFWHVEKGSAIDARDEEARWIARRILQMTDPTSDGSLLVTGDAPAGRLAQYRDIFLLFRASTDISRYETALREAGIPLYVVSGRGFYQAREVQDLVHLLRVLENPMDDYALAIVLRSPLVGVSDDTLYWLSRDWSDWTEGSPYPDRLCKDPRYGHLWAAIQQVERLAEVIPDAVPALQQFRGLMQELHGLMTAGQPLDLIDLILERTGYAHGLLVMEGGDQRFANIQKLREVAANFQRRGIFDIADFQRYLTQLEELAPREASAPLDVEESNVVRLMTVHASKGLQAPIVFLADGGREPNATTDTFLLAADGTLTCKVSSPDEEWIPPTAYRDEVKRRAIDDHWEGERLLYVALTRAEEHLVCCGGTKFPPAGKRGSYADLLAGLLDLTGPVAEDTDVPVTFQDATYPVRVWSPQSLRDVASLEPPAQAPTLWETQGTQILTGSPIAAQVLPADLERYARVVDRLQRQPVYSRRGSLRLGVSRILCYHACPRQYWFRYLLHGEFQGDRRLLPTVNDATVLTEDDRVARADGTAFGLLLHAVLQQVDFQAPLAPQVPALLDAYAREKDVKTEEADRSHVQACLARLADSPVFPALQRATTLHRELRFVAQEHGVFVPGTLDVLAQDDTGWWILDYKTGHRSTRHIRQVALYALGVKHSLGVEPRRLQVIYLDSDGPRALRDEPVTATLLDDARQLIREAGEGIRADAYPARPGTACQHCPYRGACPEGHPVDAEGQLVLW